MGDFHSVIDPAIYLIDKDNCKYCIYSNFIISIFTGILTGIDE